MELIAIVAVLDEGLWSGDSGDSSSNGASQAPAAAAFELGSDGTLNPDGETHLVSMPPLLLVAAYRFMTAPWKQTGVGAVAQPAD